jgi:hypothetical protein
VKESLKDVTDICKTGLTLAEKTSRATPDYDFANRQLVAAASNDNRQFLPSARLRLPAP